MIGTFIKGIAQGIGVMFGIIVCIMLMQWSAHLLEKMEIIETQKQRIEKLYKEYE